MYKILLVDDEPDNLALLFRTLRTKFEVKKTTNPLEALQMVQDEHFDLILSDHKMPEMDGVELLKRVYDIKPEMIRLLVTAYSDASILIDAINYAKIYRYVRKPFNPDELIITVEASLEYLQLKLDNENLVNDLKELFSGTIKAIIEALDAKDSFTLGRSRRVTFYALKIVEYLNLSSMQVGMIELAGLLHDIGMIGISDEIIYKVDKLTIDEFEEIKKHVDHGVRILEDIKQLKGVVEIIKYHHEHYDGSGYPMGLKGEQIPIGARIIAIADAYDGMVSNRAYRQGVDYEKALMNIKKLSGTQFDPELTYAFEQILPDALIEIKEFEESLIPPFN